MIVSLIKPGQAAPETEELPDGNHFIGSESITVKHQGAHDLCQGLAFGAIQYGLLFIG